MLKFYIIIVITFFVQYTGSQMMKMSKHHDEKIENQVIKEANTCPQRCQCSSPEYVDCRESQLSEMPQNIPSTAISLLLNRNKLTAITNSCFENCRKVVNLNLNENLLSDTGMSERAFEPLSHLQNLDISNNNLKKIPSRLPNTLMTLRLSGNSIKSIENESLALNNKLRYLHLQNNKLTSTGIHDSAFKNLIGLEEINLSNNLIETIPQLPDSIQLLYLNNNSVNFINRATFRKKRSLRGLYLQQNGLQNQVLANKPLSLLKQLELLDLSRNELTEVPDNLPKHITRLHLEKNKINKLSAAPLSKLKKLQYLILHKNNLNDTGIEPGALTKLRQLKVLHIYLNHLTQVPLLPKRVESVVMQANRIDKITSHNFAGAKNLTELNLRFNDISNAKIAKGGFRPLRNLKTIDLMGNKLTAVPSLPKNIENAYLGQNNIIRIPIKSVQRLTRIRHLALNRNMIKDSGIPENVFRNSSTLIVLDLSANLIKNIPRYLPENLQYLYLQGNLIKSIPKNAFSTTRNIKGIFLKNNQLLPSNVELSAFHGLHSLTIIDISWKPFPRSASLSRRKRRSKLEEVCWKELLKSTRSRLCNINKMRVGRQNNNVKT